NSRGERGPRNRNWKGGRRPLRQSGYVRIWSPEHPLADAQGYVFERLALAMKALGKMLPPHAEVHHVNRQGGDNRPGNLVICQDNAYHKLLHSRTEACEACGHADW